MNLFPLPPGTTVNLVVAIIMLVVATIFLHRRQSWLAPFSLMLAIASMLWLVFGPDTGAVFGFFGVPAVIWIQKKHETGSVQKASKYVLTTYFLAALIALLTNFVVLFFGWVKIFAGLVVALVILYLIIVVIWIISN